MVARSPNAKADRQTAAAIAAAAALNPALVRETLKKVDRCMARLQELQYTVAGGAKVVSGVSLSPRSTRGYLRTSIRCKQETVRQAPPFLSRSYPVRYRPIRPGISLTSCTSWQDEGNAREEQIPERQVRRLRGRVPVAADVAAGDAPRRDGARDRPGQPVRAGHRGGRRSPQDPQPRREDQEGDRGADAAPSPPRQGEAEPAWRHGASRGRHAAVARPCPVQDTVQAYLASRPAVVSVGEQGVPQEPAVGQEDGDVSQSRVPRSHHLFYGRVRLAVVGKETEAVLQQSVPCPGPAADAAQVPGQVAAERSGVQAEKPEQIAAQSKTRRCVSARKKPAVLLLAVQAGHKARFADKGEVVLRVANESEEGIVAWEQRRRWGRGQQHDQRTQAATRRQLDGAHCLEQDIVLICHLPDCLEQDINLV